MGQSLIGQLVNNNKNTNNKNILKKKTLKQCHLVPLRTHLHL